MRRSYSSIASCTRSSSTKSRPTRAWYSAWNAATASVRAGVVGSQFRNALLPLLDLDDVASVLAFFR